MTKIIIALAIEAILATSSGAAIAEMDLIGLDGLSVVPQQSARAAAYVEQSIPQLSGASEKEIRISGVDPRLKAASEDLGEFLSRLPRILWAQIKAIQKYGLVAMFADDSPMMKGADYAASRLGRGLGLISRVVADDMARTASLH